MNTKVLLFPCRIPISVIKEYRVIGNSMVHSFGELGAGGGSLIHVAR